MLNIMTETLFKNTIDTGAIFSKGEADILAGMSRSGNNPLSATFYNVVAKLENATGLKADRLLAKVLATCCSFAAVYVTFSWLLKKMDPTYEEKKKAHTQAKLMMKKLGIDERSLDEYEVAVAANLVDPASFDVHWNQIGGLEDIKRDLQQTVIFPLKNFALLDSSRLMKPPRGVLLYGPPGCGKTMIAKATAKASGAKFINIELSTMLDKWYGESQKRVAAIFNLAHKIQPAIIFIDEIDSLLRIRDTHDHEATNMMKTQFMNYWDGLLTDNKSQVIIIGATNNRQALDQAILRRMPCQFYVGPPDQEQRQHILEIILSDEDLDEDVNLSAIACGTEGFSGSDLHEACRVAASVRIRECIDLMNSNSSGSSDKKTQEDEKLGSLRPISMQDLKIGAEKVQGNVTQSFF